MPRAPERRHLLQRQLGLALRREQLRLESSTLGFLGLELSGEVAGGRERGRSRGGEEQSALARLKLLELAHALVEVSLQLGLLGVVV